ncbi:MAG: hypothetical protein MSIBF_02785 [Candidatus Altiarchaeales archaeon IMC4]|nr:MAG: hypothetical protein MSIBF_02785 [Candidatus Altiarchaeales archaeon IMC4]
MYVTKADGRLEKFDFYKIVRTCKRSGVPQNEAERIAGEIERQAYDGIPTRDLLNIILTHLEKRNAGYASRYDLKGAIMRLGPSGFAFEKFIAELFRIMGYSTQTNVIVQGRCVPHEVDVVAEKDCKRYMIECKYRNLPGVYIGIQKALYVWARFEDIRDGSDAGKCIKFDVPYLVCNTKFSDDVIQYASCRGLKVMGWSYPEGASISDILNEKKIYPVTVLRSIDTRMIGLLADANMMFCSDLSEEKLAGLGISKKRVQDIMDEVRGVLKDMV